MLDAFKNIAGGKAKSLQQQTETLETLIAASREERSAISAMLSALTAQTAKLKPLSESLEQVTENAAAVTARLDDIGKRVSTLDDRTRELEDVDKRIAALKEAARQAEATTLKAVGPDGELAKHRDVLERLSSQAFETQAMVDALQKEGATLEELRCQLREADHQVSQSAAQAAALKDDLEQVHSLAGALKADYSTIRETSHEAREDTSAALTMAREVEGKLGSLTRLNELSRTTEERVTSLNALVEHVSRKAKALETQQQAVEHAVVQVNRVNEMVWAMDTQITKLDEGMKQAATAEEMIGRIEKLSEESALRMEAATKADQEFERESAKLHKESSQMLESMRAEVSRLVACQREFETFDQRMVALHACVADAEAQMQALGATDQLVTALTQRADGMAKRFELLFSQADDLTEKQLVLETLQEKLSEVDDLSKRASWQADALRQSRADLELVQGEIQQFYASHAQLSKLADQLGSDRNALEAFGDRLASMQTQAPELEAKMNALLGKLDLVEEGDRQGHTAGRIGRGARCASLARQRAHSVRREA